MYVRYGGVTPAMKPYPNKYNVDTLKGQTALRRGRWKIITGDPGMIEITHKEFLIYFYKL